MRFVSTLGICAFALAGCSERDDGGGQVGEAVAMLGQAGMVRTVVFGDSRYQERLAEILDGKRPMDFHWVSITVPENADLVNGWSIDLASANQLVAFSQVYRDVCNPAAENFNSCWLYESYQAGSAGLSGGVQLNSDGLRITGTWEVTWEGLTDRFGPPLQSHRHSTSGGYAARIVGGAQ